MRISAMFNVKLERCMTFVLTDLFFFLKEN